VYGRYALVAALAVVFSACSTLGVNETVGRHGAILAAERDRTGLRRLLGSLLALRLGSGLATAVAFGILTTLWLRDLDRVALAAAALAVMVRGIWLALFAFFLGLNQAARWERASRSIAGRCRVAARRWCAASPVTTRR